MERAPRISFTSLGCPKALVDSERIITRLRAEGYELARKHDGADIVIVNTCGFLDSAKQESLGAIGDAMAENGKVIVTGCNAPKPKAARIALWQHPAWSDFDGFWINEDRTLIYFRGWHVTRR